METGARVTTYVFLEISFIWKYLNHKIRKRILTQVRLVKVQFNLHIRAVWSESSPGAF